MSDANKQNADEIAQAAEDASSTLEDTLEAKMAAMRDGIENPDPKPDPEPSPSPDPTPDPTPDPDPKPDPEPKPEDAPLLPSGHRRAALAKGYTAEEIDWFVENKPDEAKAEFKTLFDERQRENSEWSQRGRDLRAAGDKVSKGEEKTEDNDKSVVMLDADALVEEHPGSEDLIRALVGPVNAMAERLNATAERLSHSEEFLQNTEQEALAVQIKDFFGGKGMVPFKDTYGTDAKTLTDEQLKSRMELFEQADIISAGANDHGRDISVQDAMERAHILVSQGTRDEGIRAGIRKSMKKRTITTKSSHQSSSIADRNQSITDEEFEQRTKARIAKIQNK